MPNRKYPLRPQDEDERDLKCLVSEAISIPRRVDFRSFCPSIYDQGSLGSCTSNAWIAAFWMYLKSVGVDVSKVDFSRLEHYWKERDLEGTTKEDAGAQMRTGGKVLSKVGVCLENLWPYDISKVFDTPTAAAITEALNHKIPYYKSLSGLTGIKQYLAAMEAAGTPRGVPFGIKVYSSFESKAVSNTGFVPIPSVNSEELLGGHATLIVGYDDDLQKSTVSNFNFLSWLLDKLFGTVSAEDGGYLICRNSWGSDWGDNGYFYLPYSFFTEGLAYDPWIISEAQ
jgi:C1A family cysteine protease